MKSKAYLCKRTGKIFYSADESKQLLCGPCSAIKDPPKGCALKPPTVRCDGCERSGRPFLHPLDQLHFIEPKMLVNGQPVKAHCPECFCVVAEYSKRENPARGLMHGRKG